MLIKVFGTWINPASIESLGSVADGTAVYYTGSEDNWTVIKDKSPDEVAAEINEQLNPAADAAETITTEQLARLLGFIEYIDRLGVDDWDALCQVQADLDIPLTRPKKYESQ